MLEQQQYQQATATYHRGAGAVKNQEVEVTEEGHVGGGELGAAPHGREHQQGGGGQGDASSPERSSSGSRERRVGTGGARGRKPEELASLEAVQGHRHARSRSS